MSEKPKRRMGLAVALIFFGPVAAVVVGLLASLAADRLGLPSGGLTVIAGGSIAIGIGASAVGGG